MKTLPVITFTVLQSRPCLTQKFHDQTDEGNNVEPLVEVGHAVEASEEGHEGHSVEVNEEGRVELERPVEVSEGVGHAVEELPEVTTEASLVTTVSFFANTSTSA